MSWTDVMRGAACAVAVLACLQAPPALAESADERLQRLEDEIRQLRQMLNEQKAAQPEPGPAATTPAPVVPSPATNVAPESPRSGALIRYYISAEPLEGRPPVATAPLVEGRISDPDTLSFDPSDYDVPDSGAFSNYHDPASYRFVGVALEADLAITEAGDYEFVLYPKPAREGGSSVATRMSVRLRVDDRQVVDFSDQSSWKAQRGSMPLEPGLHRVQLWAVAASDGFGPSPTESRLLLALKGPGDATPRPLRDLRPAQQQR